jgi:hypothetical protein
MLEEFEDYLLEQGYSAYTRKGNPSTVYDYIKRIQKICIREDISENSLAANISNYVEKYVPKGVESEFGKKSHGAYIAALKKFKEFLN